MHTPSEDLFAVATESTEQAGEQSFEELLKKTEQLLSDVPAKLQSAFQAKDYRSFDEATQENLLRPLNALMEVLTRESEKYSHLQKSVEKLDKAEDTLKNLRAKIQKAFRHKMNLALSGRRMAEKDTLAHVAQIENWNADIIKASDIVSENAGAEEAIEQCIEQMESALKVWNENLRQNTDPPKKQPAPRNKKTPVRSPIQQGGEHPEDQKQKDAILRHFLSFPPLPGDQQKWSETLAKLNIYKVDYEDGTVEKNLTAAVARTLDTLEHIRQDAIEKRKPFQESIDCLRKILRRANRNMKEYLLENLPDMMLQSQGAQRSCREQMARIHVECSTAQEEICALADVIHIHHIMLQAVSQECHLPAAAYAHCILEYCTILEELIAENPNVLQKVPLKAAATDGEQAGDWKERCVKEYLDEKGAGGRLILHMAQRGVMEAIENHARREGADSAIGIIEKNLKELEMKNESLCPETNAVNAAILECLSRAADAVRTGRPSLVNLIIPGDLPPEYKKEWEEAEQKMLYESMPGQPLYSYTGEKSVSVLMEEYASVLEEAKQQWQEFRQFCGKLGAMLERDTGGQKDAVIEEILANTDEDIRMFMTGTAELNLRENLKQLENYGQDYNAMIRIVHGGALVEQARMKNPAHSLRMKSWAALVIILMEDKMKELCALHQAAQKKGGNKPARPTAMVYPQFGSFQIDVT